MKTTRILVLAAIVVSVSSVAFASQLPGSFSNQNQAKFDFLKPESENKPDLKPNSRPMDSSKIKQIQLPVESFRSMPDFVGVELDEALEKIAEHFTKSQLQINNESEIGSECPKGKDLLVVGQQPKKGSKVSNSKRSHIQITAKCLPKPADEDDDDDDDDGDD